jgi:hypothetical protein
MMSERGLGAGSTVHPLFEPGYVILCVGNLTEDKSCEKYVGISHRPFDTGSMLKIEYSNFSVMSKRSTSRTDDDVSPFT